MGVCIYYEGRLSNPDLIHSFMDQVNFFAEKMNWKAKRLSEEFGDEWHPDLVGLSLYPHPKCDTLHFHFDKEGNFVNSLWYAVAHNKKRYREFLQDLSDAPNVTFSKNFNIKKVIKSDNPPQIDLIKDMISHNFVKTQFAGVKTHITIVNLFRFIVKIFSPDLKINDDSDYYHSNDIEKLQGDMRLINYAIDNLKDFAENKKFDQELLSIDAFINEMTAHLQKAFHRLN